MNLHSCLPLRLFLTIVVGLVSGWLRHDIVNYGVDVTGGIFHRKYSSIHDFTRLLVLLSNRAQRVLSFIPGYCNEQRSEVTHFSHTSSMTRRSKGEELCIYRKYTIRETYFIHPRIPCATFNIKKIYIKTILHAFLSSHFYSPNKISS